MKVTADHSHAAKCVALLLLAAIAASCGRDASTAPVTAPAAAASATSAATSAPTSAASVATAATAAVANANAAPQEATPAAAPAPKPDFPTLKIATFDGSQYDLAAHRGRWVVVNFWATWCNPCLKEIPGLAALDKQRDDIEVIGLAYEEIEHAEMVAFLKTHPIAYPIAILDVYNPPADFETPRGLPMTYVIAPDGKVARTFLGPVEAADIRAVVDGAKAKA